MAAAILALSSAVAPDSRCALAQIYHPDKLAELTVGFEIEPRSANHHSNLLAPTFSDLRQAGCVRAVGAMAARARSPCRKMWGQEDWSEMAERA